MRGGGRVESGATVLRICGYCFGIEENEGGTNEMTIVYYTH